MDMNTPRNNWECSGCTLINKFNVRRCLVCHTRRSVQSKISIREEVDNIDDEMETPLPKKKTNDIYPLLSSPNDSHHDHHYSSKQKVSLKLNSSTKVSKPDQALSHVDCNHCPQKVDANVPHFEEKHKQKLKKVMVSWDLEKEEEEKEPLKNVVAYIDVRMDSNLTANKEIQKHIVNLGGIVKTRYYPQQLTHFIFSNGNELRALEARNGNRIFVVSPAWVEACRITQVKEVEGKFPAVIDESINFLRYSGGVNNKKKKNRNTLRKRNLDTNNDDDGNNAFGPVVGKAKKLIEPSELFDGNFRRYDDPFFSSSQREDNEDIPSFGKTYQKKNQKIMKKKERKDNNDDDEDDDEEDDDLNVIVGSKRKKNIRCISEEADDDKEEEKEGNNVDGDNGSEIITEEYSILGSPSSSNTKKLLNKAQKHTSITITNKLTIDNNVKNKLNTIENEKPEKKQQKNDMNKLEQNAMICRLDEKKSTAVIGFSGFGYHEKCSLVNMVKSMRKTFSSSGIKVVLANQDSANAKVTHLIVSNNESPSSSSSTSSSSSSTEDQYNSNVKRTVRVIFALLNNAFILSSDFLFNALDGQWPNEKDFYISGKENWNCLQEKFLQKFENKTKSHELSSSSSSSLSVEMERKRNVLLLNKKVLISQKEFNHPVELYQNLKEIINLCGGVIVSKESLANMIISNNSARGEGNSSDQMIENKCQLNKENSDVAAPYDERPVERMTLSELFDLIEFQ